MLLFLPTFVSTMPPIMTAIATTFKFNPAITLGCCCGTRTCTAALGAAVQNNLGNTLPAIGYAVTYTGSNILLVIWGMVTVYLV